MKTLSKLKIMLPDFLPFDNIEGVPENVTWNQVVETDIVQVVPNVEVYDLEWTNRLYSGSIQYYRWRGFINPKTLLPVRTELYNKPAADGEFALTSVNIINYPEDSEIEKVIKDFTY